MTLNEIFPAWMDDGGIFTAFEETGTAPWSAADIPADILNLEYHGNQSGEKTISPALMAVTGGEALSAAGRLRLAANLIARYGVKWGKLWDTLSLEYNPIENYSMVETMTDDETVDTYGKETTRTDNLSHGKTGTETQTPNTTDRETPDTTETETPNTTETETPNTTETNTINKSNSTHNTTHGFNTSAGVPSDDMTETEQGTETKAYTGNVEKRKTGTIQRTRAGTITHTRTGTDQTTYNTTETDTGTQRTVDGGEDTHTRNYNLTRSGNIGVTTSQQMLQSERDLWQMWDYFRDTVFPDLDRFLTLPIY